jgi:hypothetical protein
VGKVKNLRQWETASRIDFREDYLSAEFFDLFQALAPTGNQISIVTAKMLKKYNSLHCIMRVRVN